MQNGCPNQASGYEMANKPKIKKNERTHGEKEGEMSENTTTPLSEKKEEASNVSEQPDKGWTRNPCTRYNPLSSDNTAGQRMLTNYPTLRKNERSC